MFLPSIALFYVNSSLSFSRGDVFKDTQQTAGTTFIVFSLVFALKIKVEIIN